MSVLAAASAANAGIFFGYDEHNSNTTPLPEAQRVNSTAAADDFHAQLVAPRVVSFEPTEGIAPSSVFPAPASGTGINPLVSFGDGITAQFTNGVVRFQTPGTAGPDVQPSGRYPTDGVHYLAATDSTLIIELNEPVVAFGLWGIDIGDFNGTFSITLDNGRGGPAFTLAPHSVSGQLSGSVMFLGIIDADHPFSRVTINNSNYSTEVFAFDEIVTGELIPTPGAAALLTLAGMALAGRRRRANA